MNSKLMERKTEKHEIYVMLVSVFFFSMLHWTP